MGGGSRFRGKVGTPPWKHKGPAPARFLRGGHMEKPFLPKLVTGLDETHGVCVTVGNIYGWSDAQVAAIKRKHKPYESLPRTGDFIVANLERTVKKRRLAAGRSLMYDD